MEWKPARGGVLLLAGTLLLSCSGNRPWSKDPRPVRLPRGNAPEQPPPGQQPGRDGIVEVQAPEEAPGGPGQAHLVGAWPRRSARRISISFHKTDLHNALRFFAEVSRLNVVVADEVKGEITLSLRNVPWTEALRAVLQTKGLVAVREGNVVRVLRFEDWNRTR